MVLNAVKLRRGAGGSWKIDIDIDI